MRLLIHVWLTAAQSIAAVLAARAQPLEATKSILVLPPLQWNASASSWHYAVLPDPNQVAPLLGGLRFGMTPEQVGEHLPDRSSALHWDDLPEAKEFSQDVRYVWLPMKDAETLLGQVKSCFGDQSSVALLFFNKKMFRVSWRFLPDATCTDPSSAAEGLYAAFVPIAAVVAVSVHYATGPAEVVDVTGPDAGPLTAVRWQMRSR